MTGSRWRRPPARSNAAQFEMPFFSSILKNATFRFFIVYNLDAVDRRRTVTTLNGLLKRGGLIHNIAERLPLARIAEAHERVEGQQSVGNVVLELP